MGRYLLAGILCAFCAYGQGLQSFTVMGGGRVLGATGAGSQVYPRTSGRIWTLREFGSVSREVRVPAAVPNRGTRELLQPVEYVANEPLKDLAAGDFNGDGFADIATAGANGVAIRFANATSELSPARRISSDAASALATADFDGDGLLDLAVGTASGVLLLRGDGSLLQPAQHGPALPLPTSLLASDWNADGVPDLAALGESGTLQVLSGDGHGGFVVAGELNLPGRIAALAAADLDNDGVMDLVAASADRAQLFWFTAMRAPYRTIDLPAVAEALGVFDDVNAAHIIVRLRDREGTFLLRNRGGEFDAPQFVAHLELDRPGEISLDLNGDGTVDRVFLTRAANLAAQPRLAGSFALTKTHTGTWTAGMQGGVFTINVTGTGSAPVVTDTLPAGLTFVSANGSGWECLLGLPITCMYGGPPVSNGAYPPLLITVDVDPGAPSSMTNVVTESGGAQATDTVVLGTTGGSQPDLTVTKTHTGNLTRGGAVDYTITVTNQGGGSATGIVSVLDTPSTGLTLTGLSGTGWTCDLGQRRCERADALPPGSSYPAITAAVSVAANAPADVYNFAEVSGGGDTNTSNNGGLDSSAVPGPDLTITKTHTGNFFQGQTDATYRITVRNAGAGPTDGPLGAVVRVTDTPATGLVLTGLAGNGWTCVVADRQCSRTDVLAAGASFPQIDATFTIEPNAPASLSNFAAVFGGGDNSASNNFVEDPTTINTSYPDLTITKTHTAAMYLGLTNAPFIIQVRNQGPVPTTGTVTVTDAWPAGLTGTGGSGNGWACSGNGCNYFAPIPAGESAPPLTMQANISNSAAESLVNSATVSGGGDITPDNNTATDPFTVTAPDLTVTKTHTGNFLRGQQGATYTIVVRNLSTTAPSGANPYITEIIPAGLSLVSMSGTNWFCSGTTANVCIYNTSLPPNGVTEPVTVVVNVAADAPSQVTNTVQLTTLNERNTNNDSASDVAQIGGADLTITKTHNGSFYKQQSVNSNYFVTVTSVNGNSAGRVTVVDTPPAGMTVISMQGDGWTCTVATRTCETDAVITPSTPAPQIRVGVSIAADAAASLTNVVTVSGGGDSNSQNNTASDPTTIVPFDYNVQISKTHSGTLMRGGVATYTITVTNVGTTGPAGTAPIAVQDTPPPGFTITAMTAPLNGSCDLQTFTCLTPSVFFAPAQPISFTVTGNISNTASSPFTNVAAVQSPGDVSTSNNTANDVATLAGTDLRISKSHTGSFYRGQTQRANYAINVTAVGGESSGRIRVVETPPAGLTITSMAGPNWTCTLATLTCETDLVVTPTVPAPRIDVLVSVASDAPNNVVNSATVSGGGDADTSNNTASDPTVITSPDFRLRITKTHTGTITAGGNVTYTITVTNIGATGPSGTPTTTVTELPPAELTLTSLTSTRGACSLQARTCTEANSWLGPNESIFVTAIASVAANAAVVNNRASVQSGSDPIQFADDNVNLAPPLLMGVEPLGVYTRMHPNTTRRFTFRFENRGTPTTSPVQVVFSHDPGVSVVGFPANPNYTCTLATLTCVFPGTITTTELAIAADIAIGAASLTNWVVTARTSGGGSGIGLQYLQFYAYDADLVINKTHSGTFQQGQTGVTYTISVTNQSDYPSGPSVRVTEDPGTGLYIRSMSGAGWVCGGAVCTHQYNLQPREVKTITVVADVAANAPATVSNTATVSDEFDLHPANNSVTDVATVILTALNISVTQGVITFNRAANRYEQIVRFTNLGANVTAVAAALDGLTNATFIGAAGAVSTGTTSATVPAGSPFVELGPINTNQTVQVTLQFNRTIVAPITYNLRVIGPGPR